MQIQPESFVHLHVHSDVSPDGIQTVDDIVNKTKELGMDTCAITDHGSMASVPKFVKACNKADLKYIIGNEAYLAPGKLDVKEKDEDGNSYFHLLLLAKNLQGYQNLVKLSSIAYTEGFYYKPRIDLDLLNQYREGIVCTSACVAGAPSRLLQVGKKQAAINWCRTVQEIMGENFFLEVQNNGLGVQDDLNDFISGISGRYNIPIVATNDAHYTNAEDWETQFIVNCDMHHKTINNPTYPKQNLQAYIKSSLEMSEALEGLPYAAITNTRVIADMCETGYFEKIKVDMPIFPGLKEGVSSAEMLTKLAQIGLSRKFHKNNQAIPQKYKQRLMDELKVIHEMNYSDYFLIVWDYIRHGKECGFVASPGRGSAAGSLVCFSLGITLPDPLEMGLFFERFLNPERISLPDIDTDFGTRDIGEIQRYLIEKYDTSHVAKIGAFNRQFGKGAVKSIARGLDRSYDGAKIAGTLPDPIRGVHAKLADKIKESPSFLKNNREIVEAALKIEGTIRNPSIHPCGMVISPIPLEGFVPIWKRAKKDSLITQWEFEDLEEKGFVKFDLLKLDTIDIISEAIRLVKKHKGVSIDMEEFNYNDPKAFELISLGKLGGVFQVESEGLTALLAEVKPSSLEEISDCIALYRPGPIDSGWLSSYIENKKTGLVPPDIHPNLIPILKSTYYVPVYQEQIMRMAQVLAGYSVAESDTLRRIIGKKKIKAMEREKPKFIKGLIETSNLSDFEAQELWGRLEGWAAYGFNKAHSISYAYMTYWTAWFKAYYLAEFTTALMTIRSEKLEKIRSYVKEAREQGLILRGADINHSNIDFTIKDNEIIFGFPAIKGIGKPMAKEILLTRANVPFDSIEDFISRIRKVESRGLTSRNLQILAEVGAFDSLGYSRKELITRVQDFYQYSRNLDEYYKKMQLYLERVQEIKEFFERYPEGTPRPKGEKKPRLKKKPTMPEKPIILSQDANTIDMNALEKEAQHLGLFLSTHPSEIIDLGEHSLLTSLNELDRIAIRRGNLLDMIVYVAPGEAIKKFKYAQIISAEDQDSNALEITVSNKIIDQILSKERIIIAAVRLAVTNANTDPIRFKLVKHKVLYPYPE